MNHDTYLALLYRIHLHIEHKRTGPPEIFARNLGVSVRTLYRILSSLKDQDVHFEYCSSRQSYIYLDEHTILKYLKVLGGGGGNLKIFFKYFAHCQILAV